MYDRCLCVTEFYLRNKLTHRMDDRPMGAKIPPHLVYVHLKNKLSRISLSITLYLTVFVCSNIYK